MTDLSAYRHKRLLRHSPEPAGRRGGRKATRLRFVVQRHNARRLHFDFRLEHRGALLSWAVPKGPPTVEGERRLAVQVEDHPLEYRTFEGRIPAGHYGAGTVEIWDEGVYHPLGGPDTSVDRMLRKGHLTFTVIGRKLNGKFSLVRTKGKNWLFLRHREPDRLDTTPLSPMLARETPEPFDRKGWSFEPKWDGYRCIAEVADGKATLRSRNRLSFNERFREIVEELRLLSHDAVLDGEIVALDRNGRPSFQLLQDASAKKKLRFQIFDLLSLDGHSLLHVPLHDRRSLLQLLIPHSTILRTTEVVLNRGIAFFQRMKRKGFEGIIAKDTRSIYRPGARTTDWLKVKALHEQEFLIGGFTVSEGGRPGFSALLLGYWQGPALVYAGKVGTGFSERTLKSLQAALKNLERKTCPFSSRPAFRNTSTRWVTPRLVCEVRFAEWTNEGLLRQPVFLGLRDDRNPEDVHRETPDVPPPAIKSPTAFTHLEKIFWPDEGYTKGDLIAYYRTISSVILPYLRDRPETLHRFPNGINGPDFYQKNVTDAPAWISVVTLPSKTRGTMRAILCQNRNTLLYLSNLGCIELHPWNERVNRSGYPDYLVMDLDPQDVSFDVAISVARKIRNLLMRLRVACFCKTSGKRGLHIYVPLGARYTTEEARHFSEIISRLVEREVPEVASTVRSPAKRRKRVYIDFLQNRRGQTLAAPYSVRPVPGALVSTPLKWSEVRRGLLPSHFTIKTVPERIRKLGDLWKPVLGKRIDMEAALKRLDTILSDKPAGDKHG